LQRDGGRRDGCATFWRTSLLRPALVRQVRYSQHDLKDNVALLVLFEPRNATVEQAVAAAAAKQQQQQQLAAVGGQRSSLDQQQQQPMGVQDMLRSWLPSGWFDSSGSNGIMSYTRTSSQLLLQPVHSSHRQGTGTSHSHHHHHHPGRLYYCPVELGADAAAPHSSSPKQRQQQPGSSCSSSCSSSSAPEWVRCGVLVANTHIMFTPEKGDCKLGQARLLLHEAQAMAEWYLEQQQLSQAVSDGDRQLHAAATAAAGSGDPSSSGQTGVLASGMQAVATILAGDFNSTPSSALYHFVSRGLLDLHTVSKRNVSHMAGAASSSGSHHKGYRGFRRAAEHSRRRSIELQRQPSGGAGSSPRVGAAAGASSSSYSVLGREGSSSSSSGPAAAMAVAAATAGGASAAGLVRSSSTAAADGGVPLGSSPPPAAALPHQYQQQQARQHRWSDKEVRRAAGMSYDELVSDSEAHVMAAQLQPSQQQSSAAAAPAASSSAQIARAAAVFGQQVAAGAGAAAAATAAASAAAAVSTQQQESGVGSPPRQPLLLRHGLQLKSSYHAVLGEWHCGNVWLAALVATGCRLHSHAPPASERSC
jgi:hypothetical protein